MAFFDPTRPAYRANPYPALARLRAEAPVHWSPQFRAWVLTRYEDCAAVLRDSTRFTVDPACTSGARAEAVLAHRGAATLGMGPSLGTTSGEHHRALRRVVNPVFSPAGARRYAGLAADLAKEAIGAMPSGGTTEFMGAVANTLPRQVMAAAMGCMEGDTERVHRQLTTIQVARSNPAAGRALAEGAEIARGELATFFTSGGASFAEGSVLGELTRQEMPVDDVISVAAHIASVGADPTSGAIANAVGALASSPESWARLRSAPERVRGAVHELLRYDSPTHIAPRFAAVDTEVGGRRIRRGDSLLAMVGAANRDPAAFENPDELDIGRDARRQLSFGQGEHICLGAPLALVILEAVLAALLARFERIELAAPPVFGASVELRIPDRMPVRCV